MLLSAFPPRIDQDWSSSHVDIAATMSTSQYKAGRKFVFEHPASASSWNLPCVKRLADLSGVYSVDYGGMKFFKNSQTIDGFNWRGVDHHVPRRVAEADPEGKFIGVR